MINIEISEKQFTEIVAMERDLRLIREKLIGYTQSIIHGTEKLTGAYHTVGVTEGQYVMTVNVPETPSESNA